MSDDLVKQARHNALADMPHYASVELIEAMADRIEELEAKLAKAVEAAEKAVGHIERIPPRIATARVELCDALAELKGQGDDLQRT